MWDFFFLIKWGWDGIWEEEKKGEKGGGGGGGGGGVGWRGASY